MDGRDKDRFPVGGKKKYRQLKKKLTKDENTKKERKRRWEIREKARKSRRVAPWGEITEMAVY